MKTATQRLLTEPRPTKQSHAWGLMKTATLIVVVGGGVVAVYFLIVLSVGG